MKKRTSSIKIVKASFQDNNVRSFFLGLRMLLRRVAAAVIIVLLFIGTVISAVEGKPHRIVVDTDVDTDDLFAMLYLLKLNTSQFQLEVCSSSIYIMKQTFKSS